MNTTAKGQIGLAKVIADLVSKGYKVFLPFSDIDVVDLICMNDKFELRKLQVKFKKKMDGRIHVPLQGVQNGKRVNIDLSKIDFYAVYCPDDDCVYYIETSDMITSNLKTAFTISDDGLGLRKRKDYLEIKF